MIDERKEEKMKKKQLYSAVSTTDLDWRHLQCFSGLHLNRIRTNEKNETKNNNHSPEYTNTHTQGGGGGGTMIEKKCKWFNLLHH